MASVCDSTEVTCTPISPIDWVSRSAFLFVAPVSAYLSLLLIIGFFKFKSMRERPGDLILGISVSNFILCIYWTLSMSISELDIGCSCYATGIIASFNGFANYIYSIGLLFYLQQKLQNLLTQARIIKAYWIHIVCLVASSLFVGYLVQQNSIGQNLFGTCSKIFTCDHNIFTGTVVVVFYLFYEIYSISLYYYIKRSFASSSNNGSENFVNNYLVYLVLTTVLWLLVAMGIAYSEFSTDSTSNLTAVIVSVSNVAGVLQSVALTIYRYRDPLVRKSMRRLVFFCKASEEGRDTTQIVPRPDSASSSVIHSMSHGHDLSRPLTESMHSIVSLDSSGHINQYERFSIKRKSDLTYSVLSSIITAYMDASDVIDRDTDLSIKLTKTSIYILDEKIVFDTVSNARREFKHAKCTMIPAKLNMIAPGVFKNFIRKSFGIQQLLVSLDLHLNRKKIKEDNKGDGGKSGEFFFFSCDNKILIKSISDEEMNSLQRILKGYCEHIEKNQDTLITRIYGVFQLEWQYKPLNLIVMKSVCPYQKKYIEKTFDMKGSKYDRKSLKDNQYKDAKLVKSKTLKDFDFYRLEQTIKITEETKIRIFEAVREDLEFLWKSQLIDYSLVLFIVNKEKYNADRRKLISGPNRISEEKAGNWLYSIPIEGQPGMCYCIGIIDFLQTYTLQKMVEKNVKKLVHLDPKLDTSAQDPTVYRDRFKRFVLGILEIQGLNPVVISESGIQSSDSTTL